MEADFPATKKTFTQIVDGTNYTEAIQVNQNYYETEALETFIGAMGRSQAYSTSLKALLKNFRANASCVYKSATELTVTAGELYIGDASGNGAYRQNTSDTTVGWGNIDTGSEENSTIYYVYALADSAATTFTVKISKSATETAFRTSATATYCRKIGTFYNDSSGNIVRVADLNRNVSLGASATMAGGTAYLAATDGFVTAYTYASINGAIVHGYTDANADPTGTLVAYNKVFSNTSAAYICFPVKKGNYWQVNYSGGNDSNVTGWIPLS